MLQNPTCRLEDNKVVNGRDAGSDDESSSSSPKPSTNKRGGRGTGNEKKKMEIISKDDTTTDSDEREQRLNDTSTPKSKNPPTRSMKAPRRVGHFLRSATRSEIASAKKRLNGGVLVELEHGNGRETN